MVFLAFNSLSRDHPDCRGDRPRPADPPFQLPLSGSLLQGAGSDLLQTFQLLLSGSQGPHQEGGILADSRELSTPSLGITPRDRRAPRIRLRLSTPSLGITGTAGSVYQARILYAFNSLSRDHISARSPPSQRGRSYLSTPSLGITEPDSGIFCLSAAFCRGASSHR